MVVESVIYLNCIDWFHLLWFYCNLLCFNRLIFGREDIKPDIGHSPLDSFRILEMWGKLDLSLSLGNLAFLKGKHQLFNLLSIRIDKKYDDFEKV